MILIGFFGGIGIMLLLALAGLVFIMHCMKEADISYEDFKNLVEANEAALYNRDSRVEVWCEDTNEKVFEAGFKYPWGDNIIE